MLISVFQMSWRLLRWKGGRASKSQRTQWTQRTRKIENMRIFTAEDAEYAEKRGRHLVGFQGVRCRRLRTDRTDPPSSDFRCLGTSPFAGSLAGRVGAKEASSEWRARCGWRMIRAALGESKVSNQPVADEYASGSCYNLNVEVYLRCVLRNG